MNENAISNVLVDVDFLENEFKRIGRPHLTTVFTELRSVRFMFSELNAQLMVVCEDNIYRVV